MAERTAAWKNSYFRWPFEEGPVFDIICAWCKGTSCIKIERSAFKEKAKKTGSDGG